MTTGKHTRTHTVRSAGLEGILDGTGRLIDPALLEALLEVRHGGDAAHLVSRVASRPLGDLIGRAGKRIRGRLVELGFELGVGAAPAGEDADRCRRLAGAIEALHAGSLAIDDLQDGSRMRRGAPSLHVQYGLPIAVNIGTLLYYWPPETMSSLGLSAEIELRLLRLYNRTMVRAHLGQTIDVGIPIDTIPQEQVAGACLASMELKSGALFAMSLLFGAITAEASDDIVTAIGEFGHGFGVGLQMFDDIGNVRGAVEPAKRWEDLILRRPTWVWACAARHFSKDVYGRFVSAVHALSAGDRLPLETWFDQHDFMRRATKLAHDHVETCFAGLEAHIDGGRRPAANRLRALAAEISRAYE
jgi:geranylgeranyl pyrophosphate synthase